MPTASCPEAIIKVTLPLESACVDEAKDPLLRTTFPVGVALEPDNVTVTVVPSALVMLVGFADTATVAVAVPIGVAVQAFTTLATLREPKPVAPS